MSTASSEPKAPDAEEGKDSKPEVVYPFGCIDSFLADQVRQVNQIGHEVSITLTVGGNVVTGLLASGREYYKTFGQQYADALRRTGLDESKAKDIQKSYEDMGTRIYGKKSEEADSHDDVPVAFIHIKNARICSGTQWFEVPGGWWRGRLTSVDGFVLGSFSQSQR
jgi:hypothetical protein